MPTISLCAFLDPIIGTVNNSFSFVAALIKAPGTPHCRKCLSQTITSEECGAQRAEHTRDIFPFPGFTGEQTLPRFSQFSRECVNTSEEGLTHRKHVWVQQKTKLRFGSHHGPRSKIIMFNCGAKLLDYKCTVKVKSSYCCSASMSRHFVHAQSSGVT